MEDGGLVTSRLGGAPPGHRGYLVIDTVTLFQNNLGDVAWPA